MERMQDINYTRREFMKMSASPYSETKPPKRWSLL